MMIFHEQTPLNFTHGVAINSSRALSFILCWLRLVPRRTSTAAIRPVGVNNRDTMIKTRAKSKNDSSNFVASLCRPNSTPIIYPMTSRSNPMPPMKTPKRIAPRDPGKKGVCVALELPIEFRSGKINARAAPNPIIAMIMPTMSRVVPVNGVEKLKSNFFSLVNEERK